MTADARSTSTMVNTITGTARIAGTTSTVEVVVAVEASTDRAVGL